MKKFEYVYYTIPIFLITLWIPCVFLLDSLVKGFLLSLIITWTLSYLIFICQFLVYYQDDKF